MSTFQERFKGKMQKMTKDGVDGLSNLNTKPQQRIPSGQTNFNQTSGIRDNQEFNLQNKQANQYQVANPFNMDDYNKNDSENVGTLRQQSGKSVNQKPPKSKNDNKMPLRSPLRQTAEHMVNNNNNNSSNKHALGVNNSNHKSYNMQNGSGKKANYTDNQFYHNNSQNGNQNYHQYSGYQIPIQNNMLNQHQSVQQFPQQNYQQSLQYGGMHNNHMSSYNLGNNNNNNNQDDSLQQQILQQQQMQLQLLQQQQHQLIMQQQRMFLTQNMGPQSTNHSQLNMNNNNNNNQYDILSKQMQYMNLDNTSLSQSIAANNNNDGNESTKGSNNNNKELKEKNKKYTPYTLKEYKDRKSMTNYNYSKGLGPNIGGEEWQKKQQQKDKINEFSQQVKYMNQQNIQTQQLINQIKPQKQSKEQEGEKVMNARQKALEFAKNVPKPKQMNKIQNQDDNNSQKQQQQRRSSIRRNSQSARNQQQPNTRQNAQTKASNFKNLGQEENNYRNQGLQNQQQFDQFYEQQFNQQNQQYEGEDEIQRLERMHQQYVDQMNQINM